jgi:hypothetical protein
MVARGVLFLELKPAERAMEHLRCGCFHVRTRSDLPGDSPARQRRRRTGK